MAARFAGQIQVFSDASLRRHGGLAAVLFADPAAAPVVIQRRVPLAGSNELELQAAVWAIAEAAQRFPGQSFALFCDNQPTVLRLQAARSHGLAADAVLAALCEAAACAGAVALAEVHWVRGHGPCRGNALADQYAAQAAEGLAG